MSIIQNKITLSETNLNARALNGVHSLIECTGLEVHPSLVGLECAVQVIHAEWRSTNDTTTKNLMSKNYGRKWNNLCSIITKYVRSIFSFFFLCLHSLENMTTVTTSMFSFSPFWAECACSQTLHFDGTNHSKHIRLYKWLSFVKTYETLAVIWRVLCCSTVAWCTTCDQKHENSCSAYEWETRCVLSPQIVFFFFCVCYFVRC